MEQRLIDTNAELLELYQEWKRLTEKEGAAIQSSNWAEVRHCQKAKQQLQPKIIQASDLAKTAQEAGSDFEGRIRECINELIRLETRNSETLERMLEAVEQEKNGLDRTSHRLKQVQKSYTGSRGSAWDQYS